MRYPRQYGPAALVPFSLKPYGFDHVSVPLIAAWVKTLGERILFVYGENDPWSTHAFEVRERNDSYRFFVPAGNHFASISDLPAPEYALAMERLTSVGRRRIPGGPRLPRGAHPALRRGARRVGPRAPPRSAPGVGPRPELFEDNNTRVGGRINILP